MPNLIFRAHALDEMANDALSEIDIDEAVADADDIIDRDDGRTEYSRMMDDGRFLVIVIESDAVTVVGVQVGQSPKQAKAKMMELRYDAQVDAASVLVSGPIESGGEHSKDRLDQDRFIRYDADERVIEYEFLNARRYGVRLDDLEHRDELRNIFRDAGFQERDWGVPLSALRVVRRRPAVS